jgi:hypothetical protein
MPCPLNSVGDPALLYPVASGKLGKIYCPTDTTHKGSILCNVMQVPIKCDPKVVGQNTLWPHSLRHLPQIILLYWQVWDLPSIIWPVLMWSNHMYMCDSNSVLLIDQLQNFICRRGGFRKEEDQTYPPWCMSWSPQICTVLAVFLLNELRSSEDPTHVKFTIIKQM